MMHGHVRPSFALANLNLSCLPYSHRFNNFQFEFPSLLEAAGKITVGLHMCTGAANVFKKLKRNVHSWIIISISVLRPLRQRSLTSCLLFLNLTDARKSAGFYDCSSQISQLWNCVESWKSNRMPLARGKARELNQDVLKK